jgi:hypothetical protein
VKIPALACVLICFFAAPKLTKAFSDPPLVSGLQDVVQQSAPKLTNKDIVEMTSAGLSSEIILAKIASSSCEFDTSTESLKSLKAANVPDAVILAMVKAAASDKPIVEAREAVLRTAKVNCYSTSEVPLLPAPGDPRFIKQVRCGTDVSVLSEQDPWVKVKTVDGTVGFLSNIFVSKVVSPVVSDPSLYNSAPSNMIRSIAWRAVPWVTTSYYQAPGNATTDCLGSGSWTGNIWQGSTSCSSQYTPAQTVPINWQHVTVYNLVESGHTQMVIACTRNWALSKCSYLVPGNLFHYEMKNGKIEVFAQKSGGKKEMTLTFDVLSSQQR